MDNGRAPSRCSIRLISSPFLTSVNHISFFAPLFCYVDQLTHHHFSCCLSFFLFTFPSPSSIICVMAEDARSGGVEDGGTSRLALAGKGGDRRNAVSDAFGSEETVFAMQVDSLERKRKLPERRASDDQVNSTQPEPVHSVKKIRLTASHAAVGLRSCYSEPSSSPTLDKSLLPAEIWHHVFTFCPPRSLGNLLAVNKLFNVYLDPASSIHGAPPRPATTQATLHTWEPNAIWRKSRGLFWPQMPAPMDPKTELDMWRLACSPRCQDCGKLRAPGPDTHNFRHPGPGDDGVVVIWGFGRCLCAVCLLKCCHKVRMT